jgi:basic membrane lipoprotein Med (substrate-binding protein (PBP1-ABC) superfamily)
VCFTFSASFSLALADKNIIKVGFLAVGPISDFGWNYSTNQGRLYLEKQMGTRVQTIIAEKIPESAEAERVLEKMISQGCRLIFTASYGYLEPVVRVAARHPDVIFMQVNRKYTSKNIGTYYTHLYEPMYLAGVVAGHVTKTNKLGFIAAHPIYQILASINAFTMGARSVNPKITTKVIWINSWSDPPMEADAIKTLVDEGCDVIGHAQDNQNTVLRTCDKLGVYSCGYYSDGNSLAPKKWLTGACLDWGPFFTKITELVQNNSWKPVSYSKGMESGYIKLSSFGQTVPKDVQKKVLVLENDIKTNRLIIFKGPLKDRDGKLQLQAGQAANLDWIANMNFLVSGVQGNLSKQK